MALLALDIGTTHYKAGLFSRDGTALSIRSRPTVVHRTRDGRAYLDPAELLETVAALVGEVTRDHDTSLAAVGIASMAETGLLIDRQTGRPRSQLIPWFDTSALPQAERIATRAAPLEIFKRFGLRVSFKSSLAKLLWLNDMDPALVSGAIWLSAADFVLYHLTGLWATDHSLASRTLAFHIDRKTWDEEWLREWGFSPDLFPPALPGGSIVGRSTGTALGLPAGIPVAVCGHDHVCAALAVGAIEPGVVFDSMGTAEALVGALPERPLTDADYEIGLHCGCHVARGRNYWMGGLSTSGGAVEWVRSLAGEPRLSYETLDALLDTAPAGPTGILVFPYLLGSGSPHSDAHVRGAVIGLRASHQARDLVKALLEGVAYEVEVIRRAGETMAGQSIPTLIVAGGGTRHRAWMQIKADVSGCRIVVSPEAEATLLGAAIAAGIGCGVYSSEADAIAILNQSTAEVYVPDPGRHQRYATLYEKGYLAFQEPLRRFAPDL